jgi:hypothetical protein
MKCSRRMTQRAGRPATRARRTSVVATLALATAWAACGGTTETGDGGDGGCAGDGASTACGSATTDGGGDTGGSGETGGSGQPGGSGPSFGPQGCEVVPGGEATMDITVGMSFSEIKSVIESAGEGDVIDIEPGVYDLTTDSSDATISLNSGVTIYGNCAELRVYGSDRNAAMTNGTQRLKLTAYGSNITVNSLIMRGRTAMWIGGDDIAMHHVVVDQSNAYTDYPDVKYNRLDGFYGCFVVVDDSNRVTYDECEAWYADHMGFAVWDVPFGEPGTHDSIHYYHCSAMHCGSGWENDGNNPWGRGFDVFETTGTQTNLELDGCYAYDDLQSGFYNEGNYDGHSQSLSGVIKNSHAENCGVRIAEASINGMPLIVGLNGKEYGVPADVYGEGFYISDDVKLLNNTSRNNLRGFTVSAGQIDGFQDEGSYFGGSLAGGSIERFVSVSAKVYAFVSYGTISGSVAVVDFAGQPRRPIVFNWFTLARQMKIAPASYGDLGLNNDDVLLTSGAPASSDGRFNCSTSFSTSVSPLLSIEVDDHAFDTFDTCVDAWCDSPDDANVTAEYSESIELLPMPPAYTP